MEDKFSRIKTIYDDFHRDMLSKGRLLVKDTEIGYWGITPTTELFELFKKTNLDEHSNFLDLGSGDGRAVIIANLFTNATGIEFDAELHSFAMDLAKKAKARVTLLNKDFFDHHIGAYDYLFIHPDSHIKHKLEEKLLAEMNPKAKLVVFGPHYHPDSMKRVSTLDVQGSLVSVFKKE